MVGIDLRYRQRLLISNLKDEGVLDHRFDEVVDVEGDSHLFLEDVISLYIKFADDSIAEIDKYLNGPAIQFNKVNSYAHHLRGNSSSIGALQVAEVCRDLRTSSTHIDKDGCLEAFEKLKIAYEILKKNLNAISEIQKILLSHRARNESDRSTSRPEI